MSYLQGLRSSGKKIAVVAASVLLSAGTFYAIAQNSVATPTFSNISVQGSGGGPGGGTLTYTIYLSDTTTSSTIYYTLHLCDQTYTVNSSVSASTSPNKIVASCPSNGIDDGTASAYAQSGTTKSATAYANF